MEKNDAGCVILNNKEYEDLLKMANEPKQKEIKISYTYDYKYVNGWGNYYLFNADIKEIGEIKISEDIKRQIVDICDLLKKKLNKKYDEFVVDNEERKNEFKIDVINYTTEDLVTKFEKLPWYKRLFFNQKFIK